MKTIILSLFVALLLVSPSVRAQGLGTEFQVTKINKDLVTTPLFAYTGGPVHRTNQNERWVEMEVEFTAAPEYTDELTLRYFVLLNGKLLTGEVTHVGVLAGKGRLSVMYISPYGVARCMGNQVATANSIQNIAVQIVRKGTVKDELSLVRAPAQWYATIPPLTGLVLNKNETPFAPLWGDRYEQLKPATR
ncbi:MAG TPA: Amuc_1102 family pilus-like protein [Chthoniobacterales bacterium]|jgi:hypothetical protein